MEIYKILRPAEWADLMRTGWTRGAPIDLADGYIHFSTAEQVAGTLAKHFAGAGALVICACEADDLGANLRWEAARGGALFPHLYRPLHFSEVRWHEALAEVDGRHVLPARLT